MVISDEIYARTAFTDIPFASFGKHYPEGTIVMGGLSKDLSLGGWRVGVAVTPPTKGGRALAKALTNIATNVWSCVAAPVQYAALVAYSGDPDVEDYVKLCSRMHAIRTRYLFDLMVRLGRPLRRAFRSLLHLPLFRPWKDALQARGIQNDEELAVHLLEKYEIADPAGLGLPLHPGLLPEDLLLLHRPGHGRTGRRSGGSVQGEPRPGALHSEPPPPAPEGGRALRGVRGGVGPMREVVIIEGVRSPVGRHNGALSSVRPDDLLAEVLKGLQARIGFDPSLVEDVYMGCGNQAGEDNRDVARMSVLLAGWPVTVSGVTVNRNCSSALEAVNQAAKAILAGEGDVFVAGGVECMSRAPWAMAKPERPQPVGHPTMWDTTVGWRFNNPKLDALYPIVSLGETAENIAEEMGITREDQDAFALESHRRAVEAMDAGRFRSEIVPIPVPQRKGEPVMVDTDEHPRFRRDGRRFVLDTDMAQMARLKAAFRAGGTVTAGNSSGINDGAAALLLMSREKAEELGLKPMARWMGSAVAGVDPGVMGYGPVPSTKKLLARLGLGLDQLGLVELNEAFAAQALGVMRRLGLKPEITNVNGGAIALGHPTGCSGARILVTLLHEMKRRASGQQRPYYGLATLCVGVGMGVSTVVEWLDE